MLGHALRLADGQPHLRAAVGRLHPVPLHARSTRRCRRARSRKLFGLGYMLGRWCRLARSPAPTVLGYALRASRRRLARHAPPAPGDHRRRLRRRRAPSTNRRAPTRSSAASSPRACCSSAGGSDARSAGDWHGRRWPPRAARDAAFFVKQTRRRSCSRWRPRPAGAACRASPSSTACTLAIVGLPSLWLLNRASDGWFWTYISELHQSKHEFPRARVSRHPGRLL